MIRRRNPGQFGIQAESRIDIEEYYDRLILPYAKAPVLIHHKNLPILTAGPPPFVAAHRHDRCPVFLDVGPGVKWLENEGGAPERLKEFLVGNKAQPNLGIQKQRPMRPGWEKRK